MSSIVRAFTLVGAATALSSLNPLPTASPALLAFLDPTNSFASLCGGKDGSSAMRSNISASAAILGQSAVPAAEPLYDGLGAIRFPITTASPLAQRYFDQGMAFAYGFNHSAAVAAFREAQRNDPECALCYWGEAFAFGPNINAPMDVETNARVVSLARYADWLARRGTAEEQALTAALLKRYSLDEQAERSQLDSAFADAMFEVAAKYPANDHIALLAAEAAMNTRPWDYWTADKKPNPRIGEAVRLVEMVYRRNPDHPQSAHLYIHLMENGPDPTVAEAAADRLAKPLAPTAGHLVHMPAHIYYRLGRWKDSMRVNRSAAIADETWIKASGDKGLVRYGYYPHNVHFIVTSAQMAGDGDTAARQSAKLARLLDPKISSQVAWIEAVNAAPFFVAAQFARPAEILAMKAPDERLRYPAAMRHYARAIAFADLRNRAGFDRELRAIQAARSSNSFESMISQGVPAPDLLGVAEAVARGRWDYKHGRFKAAAKSYRSAAELQSKIHYMEPPFWYFPVEQSFGAALYRAGDFNGARQAFLAALSQSPNNGWALFGLAASERALGRHLQAAASEAALKRAWTGDRRWLTIDRL